MIFVGTICLISAAASGFFYAFAVLFPVGVFIVLLGVGPANISIISTLPLEVRGLGNGYNIFF